MSRGQRRTMPVKSHAPSMIKRQTNRSYKEILHWKVCIRTCITKYYISNIQWINKNTFMRTFLLCFIPWGANKEHYIYADFSPLFHPLRCQQGTFNAYTILLKYHILYWIVFSFFAFLKRMKTSILNFNNLKNA